MELPIQFQGRGMFRFLSPWLCAAHSVVLLFGERICSREEPVRARADRGETAHNEPLGDVEQAMRCYGTSIFRLAYAYLHHRADAEDVLQDTLLQYMRKAPTFENGTHEKAWLLRVAVNLSKNRLKHGQLHPQEELSDLMPNQSDWEGLSFVWDCVRALPVPYREVIHLYYHEGYSTAEVASLLKKKEATVRSLLARARALMKKELKEAYDFE